MKKCSGEKKEGMFAYEGERYGTVVRNLNEMGIAAV